MLSLGPQLTTAVFPSSSLPSITTQDEVRPCRLPRESLGCQSPSREIGSHPLLWMCILRVSVPLTLSLFTSPILYAFWHRSKCSWDKRTSAKRQEVDHGTLMRTTDFCLLPVDLSQHSYRQIPPTKGRSCTSSGGRFYDVFFRGRTVVQVQQKYPTVG